MIQLINFSKSYSSKSPFAVSDINMTCEKGSITGILGLNGAGKTTILKAITARHFATSGSVLVEGIEAGENAEQVRNLTGFVEEEPKLPGEYTVEEYLSQVFSLHQEKESHTDSEFLRNSNSKMILRSKIESVWQYENSLSISDLLPKKIKTLSKGQRQRVNFAQALIYNPSVLVLDEPASGLDPAQIINMRSLVKSLKDEHTILLSTHLMQEVDSLCDKVYILHQGKIAASGRPDEIASQFKCKNLEEAFFKITRSSDIVGE
ncbi:MAG: ABC transporter ATP-binding protein [Treponema sp.]|nr:ABC transporter ATP-binding protein [Treponema sp.]